MASRAVLFLMVGPPAAGKTTVARSLEAEHHAMRLTPDEWMIPLTWSEWASVRWPSLPGLDHLVDSRMSDGGAA